MKALKWPSKKHSGNARYNLLAELWHDIKGDIQMLPVRLWISRVWMTLGFLVWYFFYSIKEWRAQTALFKWELWVPDYEETREEFSVTIKQVRNSR